MSTPRVFDNVGTYAEVRTLTLRDPDGITPAAARAAVDALVERPLNAPPNGRGFVADGLRGVSR